ncbi:MAG: hypothetical protein ACEQSB_06060 [Undibacterium sp.]
MKAMIVALFGLSQLSYGLEVHEWGTFTVLADSGGTMTPWYLSYSDAFRLPEFVGRPRGGKSGASLIRMETPVLYFYPKETTHISVEVTFKDGLITETFPFRKGVPSSEGSRATEALPSALWTGTLSPPNHQPARANVPTIKGNEDAEHYGAACEVPDAWIFQTDHTLSPYSVNYDLHFPQADHFIFYRGSGDATLPLTSSLSSDGKAISLLPQEGAEVPFAVALEVSGDQAAWKPLLKPPAGTRRLRGVFDESLRPLDLIEDELRAAWRTALVDQGLTAAEAAAMVNTWAKTWFREPGVRILTIVPRAWPDQVLPLTITPVPEKITRVFVARIEMIPLEKSKQLAAILSDERPPTEETLAAYRSLKLGRFYSGAATLAGDLMRTEMQSRAFRLQFSKEENLRDTQ